MRGNENTPITVSLLNELIKEKIEGDYAFRSLWVRGEISNFKVYSSGHAYFSLKDEQSIVSSVMWRTYAEGLDFRPKDGDEVLVHGRLTVYPARGSYQLTVDHMELFGQGAELLKLKLLAEKLAKEGLFDESKKRPLPRFPKKVGVIAGKGSAGLRDIVVNLSSRWPLSELVVLPSLVQGKEAPKDLMKAFAKAQAAKLDTLIIARGGGSSEDLSAFNDEELVRLVATSSCPVISAVGHEVDTTLIDLVADKRVSTPTAAAIAAVPDKNEILQGIDLSSERLNKALERRFEHDKRILGLLSARPFFLAPESLYAERRKSLGDLSKRFDLMAESALERRKTELAGLAKTLNALGPKSVLARGYSIAADENGRPLVSAAKVHKGQVIKTTFKDGIITSTVTAKEETHGKDQDL